MELRMSPDMHLQQDHAQDEPESLRMLQMAVRSLGSTDHDCRRIIDHDINGDRQQDSGGVNQVFEKLIAGPPVHQHIPC